MQLEQLLQVQLHGQLEQPRVLQEQLHGQLVQQVQHQCFAQQVPPHGQLQPLEQPRVPLLQVPQLQAQALLLLLASSRHSQIERWQQGHNPFQ